MSNAEDELVRHLKSWAKQTIAFARLVRMKEPGSKPENLPEPQAEADEIERIGRGLWEKAFAECDRPGDPEQLVFHLTRRVLDWCASHRGFKRAMNQG